MYKKHGFTLLELLIVMVIMAIILGMTMGFGADRVRQLDRQSVSDQFVDGFNSLVGQSRTSSYFNNQRYSQILINFASGAHGMSVTLSGFTTSLFSGFTSSVFTLERILAGGDVVSSLDVRLIPYGIGCSVYTTNKQFSGALLTSYISRERHCYYLSSSLCTIKKVNCQ